MKRTHFTAATLLAGCALAFIAAIVPVVLPTYTFTSAVTIPIANSDLQPLYLTALEMSFAAPVSNTMTVTHISSGATNTLLTISDDSMKTLVWFVPRPLFLADGDTLSISNEAAVVAVVKLSAEKYKN